VTTKQPIAAAVVTGLPQPGEGGSGTPQAGRLPSNPATFSSRVRRLAAQLWPWLLALAIGYLVLLPLGALFYGAVRTDPPGSPDADFTGEWFRETYVGVFTGGPIQRVVWHSLAVAIPTTAIATVLGVGLAWLLARTDVPGRRFFEYGFIIPMFYSPLVGIIGWTILGAPGGGWANYYWSETFGGQGAFFNIYSFWGIVWVMSLFYLPYAIIFNTATFRTMDATQEEAAAVAGASRWKILSRITIPLMRPSILAAAIFIFIFCLEQFSIPGALGSQIRYETLAYSIYLNVNKYPSNVGLAAAKGTLLLLLTIVMLLFYRRMLSRASRFVTVGSKGQRPATIELGKWRPVAACFCALVLLIGTILPLVAIILRSLMSSRTIGIDWGSLNFGSFADLVTAPNFIEAAKNSVTLSIGAAVLAAIVGLVVAVSTIRLPRNKAFTFSDYLISAPVALPGTVFGIGLFWAYIGSPLYQSLMLLLIAFVTRYAVFGLRMLGSGLVQIDKSLSEAALVSGASRARAVALIDFPLLTGAMSAAWLLIFLSVMRELATSIIIYGVDSRTLAILTWNYMEDGFYDTASALALAQILIVMVIVLVAKVLFGRRLALGDAIGRSSQ
jgi:iron(III) transport system permease protein